MMPVNLEKELMTMYRKFNTLGNIERATWYEWRQAALEFAREGTDPLDLVLRAWEIVGHDTAKSYFGGLDVTKGPKRFVTDIARRIVASSINMGEDAKVVESDKDNEVYVRWDRCPWPDFARRYDAPMEEDLQGCDKWFMTVIEDINEVFNTHVQLETQAAIPSGDCHCLRRIWVDEWHHTKDYTLVKPGEEPTDASKAKANAGQKKEA